MHEIEYLASVVLDSLTEYPTAEGRHRRSTAACRTPLLTALGLTEERTDLVFGYLLPTQEAWDAGSKGATCVVGAADGSSLRGTLADIGPSALPTLPGAPDCGDAARGIAERHEPRAHGASGSAGAPQRRLRHCRAKRVGADRSAAESGDEDLDVVDGGEALELVEAVPGGDEADRPRP